MSYISCINLIQSLLNYSISIIVLLNLEEIMSNNFEIITKIFIYINFVNIVDLFLGIKITKEYLNQKAYIFHHILSIATMTYIINTSDIELQQMSKYILYAEITAYYGSLKNIIRLCIILIDYNPEYLSINYYNNLDLSILTIILYLICYSNSYVELFALALINYHWSLNTLLYYFIILFDKIIYKIYQSKILEFIFGYCFIVYRSNALYNMYNDYLYKCGFGLYNSVFISYIILHLIWYIIIINKLFNYVIKFCKFIKQKIIN